MVSFFNFQQRQKTWQNTSWITELLLQCHSTYETLIYFLKQLIFENKRCCMLGCLIFASMIFGNKTGFNLWAWTLNIKQCKLKRSESWDEEHLLSKLLYRELADGSLVFVCEVDIYGKIIVYLNVLRIGYGKPSWVSWRLENSHLLNKTSGLPKIFTVAVFRSSGDWPVQRKDQPSQHLTLTQL